MSRDIRNRRETRSRHRIGREKGAQQEKDLDWRDILQSRIQEEGKVVKPQGFGSRKRRSGNYGVPRGGVGGGCGSCG